MSIKAVRGMHDLYGEELRRWSAVEKKMRAVCEAFGYSEIRTPALEQVEVFKQTVGDDTDIVQKQMYLVANQEATEKLVLRPEGTASFIRAVIEHGLHQSGQPQRFYYNMPMFRYERPQKGRQRQFHQLGVELILDPTPEADAEVIALLDHLFRSLGLRNFEARINAIGCADCRPAYKKALVDYLRPRLSQLCPLCQSRFERSPMRVLDCKNESCQAVIKDAPTISSSLCDACKTHHAQVLKRLKELKLTFIEDPKIVRGLDYYNRTAFEFLSSSLGAQSALGGGGRYDGLSSRFGEKPFPAIGWAVGIERVLIALEQEGLLPKLDPVNDVYFAALGQQALDLLIPISISLKKQGVPVHLLYEADKSLKSHLKSADKLGAQFTVVLGENELAQKKVLLKNMRTSEQEMIDLSNLESTLKGKVKRAD